MRHDPSIADTQECQAIVDAPRAEWCHDSHKQYLSNASRRCDLARTQPLPVFCPEVRPLSQWSPAALDRLLADVRGAL